MRPLCNRPIGLVVACTVEHGVRLEGYGCRHWAIVRVRGKSWIFGLF